MLARIIRETVMKVSNRVGAEGVVRRFVWRLPSSWRQRRRMIALYSQFVSEGDLCFDVGANYGLRSLVLGKLGARVVAIEPQLECVRALSRLRWLGVDVLPIAVGRSAKIEVLSVGSVSTISSLSSEFVNRAALSGRFGSYAWTASRAVPVLPLEAVIASFGVPRFVKIDVEGFELAVLEGLQSCVPVVSFEFSSDSPDAADACMRRMEGLGGYEFALSWGESMSIGGSWGGREAVMSTVRSHDGRFGWGDIYARLREDATSTS